MLLNVRHQLPCIAFVIGIVEEWHGDAHGLDELDAGLHTVGVLDKVRVLPVGLVHVLGQGYEH